MENRIMKDMDLLDVAKSVEIEMGLKSITAEFTAVKDFKLQWTRNMFSEASNAEMHFRVSDYLKEAPTDAVKSLMKSVVERLLGLTEPNEDGLVTTGHEFGEYVESDEFLQRNQRIYIRRHRNFKRLSDVDEGFNERLHEMYRSLEERGYLKVADGVEFLVHKSSAKSLTHSVIMRTIQVDMSMKGWSDYALDVFLIENAYSIGMGYRDWKARSEKHQREINDLVERRDREEFECIGYEWVRMTKYW